MSMGRLNQVGSIEMEYNGYWITECNDGTFDVLDGAELVDGEFKSTQAAKDYIDDHLKG